jgi:aminoglycoside/choline kinase family phosphotransferase
MTLQATALPCAPEQITPEWLSAALRRAGVDPDNGQGVVLLDDLVAGGCSFGEPVQPWSGDRVAAALAVQAGWHGQTWGMAPGGRDWLTVGSSSVRAACAVLLSAEHWQQHFAAEGAPALTDSTQDRDRIRRAFGALWAADDARTPCVAHGDAHIGNAYVDAGGQPGFLDWQGVCLGPWSYDVAYFIGGALSVEDRRTHERALLRVYLDVLAASGGPRIDDEEAWLDYRRHTLHGFLWAVTPAVMQPLERVVAMAERHAIAIEDHDSLAAIGV